MTSKSSIFVAGLVLSAPTALAAGHPGSASTSGATPVAEVGLARAWGATVYVESRRWRDGRGGPPTQRGSGVIVGQDPDTRRAWVLTSWHVVRCRDACSTRIALPTPDGRGRAARARVVGADPRSDLALLRVRLPRGLEVPTAALRDPGRSVEPEESLVAIGFPESPSEPERARREWAEGCLLEARADYRLAVHPAGVTGVEGRLEIDAALVHTVPLQPGYSGGPVVDGTGAVVGITAGVLDGGRAAAHRAGLAIAIGLPPLFDLLERTVLD